MWLINPGKRKKNRKRARARKRNPAKKRRARRGPPAGFSSWKAYMSHIRGMKKGSKHTTTRKRNPGMARRKSRSRKAGTTRKTTRRRRCYRRNPSIVTTLTNGVKHAAFVVGGKAASRAIPAAAGLETTGIMGIGIQAAVAVGVGMLAEKFVGKEAADFALAGALAAPIESFVEGANIPFISAALSAYPQPVYIPRGGRNLGALAGYPNRAAAAAAAQGAGDYAYMS